MLVSGVLYTYIIYYMLSVNWIRIFDNHLTQQIVIYNITNASDLPEIQGEPVMQCTRYYLHV